MTGEDESLDRVLPLIKKYDCAVVAISNDETGISEDPDVRFDVAKKIVERAADYGIKSQDVVVDPLVMPIGAMGTAGKQVFALVRRLREELKVNTTCGASNISFGLPNRRALNGHFLSMASCAGMTSAIMNPLHSEDMTAIRAANVLNGADKDCRVLGPHLPRADIGGCGQCRGCRTPPRPREPPAPPGLTGASWPIRRRMTLSSFSRRPASVGGLRSAHRS